MVLGTSLLTSEVLLFLQSIQCIVLRLQLYVELHWYARKHGGRQETGDPFFLELAFRVHLARTVGLHL